MYTEVKRTATKPDGSPIVMTEVHDILEREVKKAIEYIAKFQEIVALGNIVHAIEWKAGSAMWAEYIIRDLEPILTYIEVGRKQEDDTYTPPSIEDIVDWMEGTRHSYERDLIGRTGNAYRHSSSEFTNLANQAEWIAKSDVLKIWAECCGDPYRYGF